MGHGLKDMAVKEVRRSIAILDMSNGNETGPNHGLIRDVLLNPQAYKEFLLEAYETVVRWGITQEELDELKSFQAALGISDEEAACMNVEAAMKSAAKDGEISEEEKSSIKKAAVEADMDANEAVETAEKKAKKSKSKK